MNVEVTVRNLQRKYTVDRGRCERLAVKVLTTTGREGAQVAIVLVRDWRIRAMNLRYRGVDAPTDVLAFPQEGPGPAVGEEILGDVVVSVETAARQAKSRGKSLDRELDLLVVHGLLHLCGFDHVGSREEREEMQRRQRSILRGWKG